MTCVSSKDPDQLGHQCSLVRLCYSNESKVLLWTVKTSQTVDVQADLSLCWAYMQFVDCHAQPHINDKSAKILRVA